MPVSAARKVAYETLLRVDRDGAHSDEALHSPRVDRLSQRERALATEMVMGCLRRQGELDHAVDLRLTRGPRSLDPEIRTILRLGAYQIRHMRTIPTHAAVSESVELARVVRKRSATGLVNAVLRRLPPPPPCGVAAQQSHPPWLVKRWRTALGTRRCEALLTAHLQRPDTYFRIPGTVAPEPTLASLSEAGLTVEPTDLPRAYRLASGSVAQAQDATNGALRFQDLNSQRVATLLCPLGAGPVLDVCAAPGGKARILAEEATVVASDRRPGRLRRMRALGSDGLRPVLLDAERPLPFQHAFEWILVDAPCSGTGTLARNPEIKWRLRPDDLNDLQARQIRILRNGLQALAMGGLLVYATCSLEPEENEDVVEAAVEDRPVWRARLALASVPGTDPGDGFQAWVIERRLA